VVVDLTLGERLPTLTGRLLDQRGAPIPWAFFDLRWSGDEPDLGLHMDYGVTDGDGRFRFDLDETPSDSESLMLELSVSSVDEHERVLAFTAEEVTDHRENAHKARVRVTQPLKPGDIDLGDIVLEPEMH